jgi:hypothetical protein
LDLKPQTGASSARFLLMRPSTKGAGRDNYQSPLRYVVTATAVPPDKCSAKGFFLSPDVEFFGNSDVLPVCISTLRKPC